MSIKIVAPTPPPPIYEKINKFSMSPGDTFIDESGCIVLIYLSPTQILMVGGIPSVIGRYSDLKNLYRRANLSIHVDD